MSDLYVEIILNMSVFTLSAVNCVVIIDKTKKKR